jgi:hypothetical protein
MNLRPLVLGLSFLAVAGAASVSFAQQAGPQQVGDNDLGLSPAQLADFAGPSDVVYAAGPAQPETGAAQSWMPNQRAYPGVAPPDMSAQQMLLMGYQAAPAAAPAQSPGQPATPQMAAPPSAAIAPNWPNANFPQPMMSGPGGPYGCGPDCGPYGPVGGPPAPGYPNGLATGYTPPRPCWYFRGDAVFLTRSHADDHNLTSYANLNTPSDRLNGHVLLETDDVTYPLEPGMRLTFGRYITDTWMVEGTYYGAFSWDRTSGTPTFPTGANGLGPLFPYWGPSLTGAPFDTSAFTGSNVQTASYETQFNSFEVNVRHAIWGTTTILAGFRYINIGDLFQLSASDNANSSNPGGTGLYRTWTNNNLVGFQLGTEYAHDLWWPRLFGSVDGRGGIYANAAEQKSLLFNSGDTYNQRSDRQAQFASVWDLTFTLSFVATDHLTIRGGYTFLFIDGVALAPDQLDTTPTTLSSRRFIADNDTLTLQGPFVGGELAW